MIGLVYLAWAPLGLAPLREFLRSYHHHPAGAKHQLIVVLNGRSAMSRSTQTATPPGARRCVPPCWRSWAITSTG